jgi:hypothetical protein
MYNYALIIILIVILVFYNYSLCDNYHCLLSGFWEADRTFCEESGLDLFSMYIDDDYDFMGNRACYILASHNNTVVLNEPTNTCISLHSTNINNWCGIKAPKYFSIEFENISEEAEEIFPKKQSLRFYPICNKIVLYFNTTITAVLYKNPVNSEMKFIKKDEDENKE